MKSIKLVLLMALINSGLHAQTIQNNTSTLDAINGKVTITYDLIYTDPNQKFNVSFFSSHDNYSQPLKQVSGDGGDNVLPGKMKRASWDAKRELPADFDGDIQIKIKVTKMLGPKLNMEPLALKTYKRGNTISMKWTGGYPSDKVTIDLKKGNAPNLTVVDKIDNTGVYEWKLPNHVKGKGYSLILTNANQPGEPVSSSEFEVKPRIPLLVKILPFVAVGGAVAVIIINKNKNTDEVLPPPVKPN